jgi:predicted enzyme related to lactoylglutathione lyase
VYCVRASVVLYVGNLALMRDFYRVCFGFGVADDARTYCRLEMEAWELTLVQSVDAVPTSSPPPRRAATPIKLIFGVLSIEAVRDLIEDRGGHLDPASTTWKFRSTLRCDCTDPEGNVVQLVQPRDSG